MVNKRESNLELLRIVSIILIIMHHFALYTELNFGNYITSNRLIIQFLTIGGKAGACCFLLISGYFMINQKFKLKKFIKLILQLLTYCILGFVLSIIVNGAHYSLLNALQLLFLSIFGSYWFMLPYLIVYMLSPFINKAFNCFNKNELKKLIILLILLQSFFPTFSFLNFEFSNVIWFITLYIIGAYFSRFKEAIPNKKTSIILLISSYLVSFLLVLGIDFLKNITYVRFNTFYFASVNSPFTLIISVSLFLFFIKIKVFYNKFINIIASTTLGIYLFHDNTFFKHFMWDNLAYLLNINTNTSYLFLKAIVSILIVFVCGFIVELIRKNTLERITNKVIDKFLLSKKE